MTIAEFQTEFLSHAKLPEPIDAKSIVEDYITTRSKTITQAEELGVGKEGLEDIKMKCGRAFIKKWMMLKYASIDLSFTDKKWWLHIERDENNGNNVKILNGYGQKPEDIQDDGGIVSSVVEAPVFFSAKAGAKNFAFNERLLEQKEVEIGELRAGRRKKEYYREVRLRLSAKLPDGVINKHRQLAAEALAHFSLAVAILYAKGIDIKKECYDDNIEYFDSARHQRAIKVIWAPDVYALSIRAEPPRPVGDPAIIFTVYGQNFLLDFYETPDEKSIEHLIREFSEGKLNL